MTLPSNVARLIEIGGPPLAQPPTMRHTPTSLEPLMDMLRTKNGFLAFESALRVRPIQSSGEHQGVVDWNDPSGWRRHYGGVPRTAIFFGEDVFGGQFAVHGERIMRLNPETGAYEHHSASLDAWAERLLANYSYETGWELAHAWQLANRPLEVDERLVPLQPFVLGGDFDVPNLVAVRASKALESYGRLFSAIRDAPDGTPITLDFWLKD